MSARIGSIPVPPRTTSRANRCQRRAPRTIEWPPGVAKRATRRAGLPGPQGEVRRELRRHPAVAAAVQDRDGPAAQVIRPAHPGGVQGASAQTAATCGSPPARSAARPPIECPTSTIGTLGAVLVAQPLDRPADVGVGVGRGAVPAGHPVAEQVRADAPVAGAARADELLDGAHPHQRQGGVARRGHAASPSRRGRTAPGRGPRRAAVALQARAVDGWVRHAAVLGSLPSSGGRSRTLRTPAPAGWPGFRRGGDRRGAWPGPGRRGRRPASRARLTRLGPLPPLEARGPPAAAGRW